MTTRHSLRNASAYILLLLFGLLLAACGNEPNNLEGDEGDFDDLRPFSLTGAYSAVITNCVKAETASDSCTLETLPLLGQEVEDPTVDDIMNRLVISHDWMAENFEDILNLLPAEILPLFKGLTAVVIDDDIRPAFYTTATGAIYLDPAYLWLSIPDKRTINTKQDYRESFDDGLAFQALGYYTKNNQYAYNGGSLTDENPRALEDTLYLLTRLLLHELAHANDFLPPHRYDTLDMGMTVSQAANALKSERPSNGLEIRYPLNSQLNKDFAEIMYFGNTATSAQREVTAEEIGLEFEPDGASDHYGYSNQFEDAAMLFETALMKQFFDFNYDVFFVDTPADPGNCSDYVVRWGQFNRVGDANVKTRAQYIIGELLPALDTTLFFQDLAPPDDMTTGISWCENLNPETIDDADSPLRSKPAKPNTPNIPGELQHRAYL